MVAIRAGFFADFGRQVVAELVRLPSADTLLAGNNSGRAFISSASFLRR
jgi:hypothetical protein